MNELTIIKGGGNFTQDIILNGTRLKDITAYSITSEGAYNIQHVTLELVANVEIKGPKPLTEKEKTEKTKQFQEICKGICK